MAIQLLKKHNLDVSKESLQKVENSINLYKSGSSTRFKRKLVELTKARNYIIRKL